MEINKARQTITNLKDNFKSVIRIRDQIREEDRDECDKKLAEIREWMNGEISKFSAIDKELTDYLGSDLHDILCEGKSPGCTSYCKLCHPFLWHTKRNNILIPDTSQDGFDSHSYVQKQATAHTDQAADLRSTIASHHDTEERIEEMANDIDNVHQIMGTLHGMVHVCSYNNCHKKAVERASLFVPSVL